MLPTRDPLDREHAVPHALRRRPAGLPRLQRHRLHQRHRPAAAAGALAPGHVRHHHGGRHQQRRGAGGEELRQRRPAVHGHELGQGEHHGARRRAHQPERRLRFGHQARTGIHRRVAHAAHHHPGRPDHRRARQGWPPARAHRQERRRLLHLVRIVRLPQAGLSRRIRAWPRRDRAGEPRRVPPHLPRRRQDEDLRLPVGVLRLPELELRGRERRGHALSQRRHHGARRGRGGSARPPSPAPSSSTRPHGRARSCRATRKCATAWRR